MLREEQDQAFGEEMRRTGEQALRLSWRRSGKVDPERVVSVHSVLGLLRVRVMGRQRMRMRMIQRSIS
jgi:hypothetical protein